jgi:NADH-quinone oxidoreductase subunit I
VVGDDGRPQELPWEDWREGEDLMTSAWVRATAPAGRADYEGVVAWSGELGYGVRAPEPPQTDADAVLADEAAEVDDAHDEHDTGAHH